MKPHIARMLRFYEPRDPKTPAEHERRAMLLLEELGPLLPPRIARALRVLEIVEYEARPGPFCSIYQEILHRAEEAMKEEKP